MVRLSLQIFAFVVVGSTFFGHLVFGQNKTQPDFPTYQQLKSGNSEIIDYFPTGPFIRTSFRRISYTDTTTGYPLNLFDYPKGSVTYYLNEQPTTDVNYVREVIRNKSVSIQTISIGKPDENDKRTIRIRYEAF
ncbi:hypothetical protein WBJ53_12355 [Spirosoma sp. SC4-14]|uniref:hypothetical protein n=1 Tax=Spirosoma sp. SC4-14 TaxID=3128900 RepID=UPI0030D11F2D